ncbi:TonB family protein [Rhodovulum sp. P5]|uniref:TonB family protein n=1 Tax=Rhodovulum sp. P5 TaxID=1564506 RepID=UPI0012EB0748|nr:TonB family protein [Rhodovulum sp. P5]
MGRPARGGPDARRTERAPCAASPSGQSGRVCRSVPAAGRPSRAKRPALHRGAGHIPHPGRASPCQAPAAAASRTGRRPAHRRPRPQARPHAAPATKAPTAAPAAAPQRAAGTGGKGHAGRAASPAASTLSEARAHSLIAKWGAGIRARVERRKRYPRAAGRAAGTVTIALTVAPDGRLQSAHIARTSGHPALDAAALGAVRAAAPFARAAKGLTDSSYRFTLPIRFAP